MWIAPDWSPTTISCWLGWRQAQVTGALAWKIRWGGERWSLSFYLWKSIPGRRDFAFWDPKFWLCNPLLLWTSTFLLPVHWKWYFISLCQNWLHLKSNRHHVFADALKVDNRREIARCEIEHPEQHSMYPSHRMQLSDNGLVGRKRSEQCLQRETRCCGLEWRTSQRFTLCADNHPQPTCYHQALLPKNLPTRVLIEQKPVLPVVCERVRFEDI